MHDVGVGDVDCSRVVDLLEGSSHKARAIVLPLDKARDRFNELVRIVFVARVGVVGSPLVAPLEHGCLIPKRVGFKAGLEVDLALDDVQDQPITGYFLVVLHFDDVALLDLAPGAAFEVPTLHLVRVLLNGLGVDLLSNF